MKVDNAALQEKLKFLKYGITKSSTAMRTMVIRFDCVDGKVYAYTDSGVNNIRAYVGDNKEDFHAIIQYDIFANFIKSCEGETLDLGVTDKYMTIKAANVKTKLAFASERKDDCGVGDPCKTDKSYDYDVNMDIPVSALKSVLDTEHPVEAFSKVCFGDQVIVTDGDSVIKVNKHMLATTCLLDFSSVELLSQLHNVKCCYTDNKGFKQLRVKADEVCAAITLDTANLVNFQYDDFIELFDSVTGKTVDIDTKVLSKAMTTSELFDGTATLVFNSKGVFVKVENADYIYKIADTPCDEHTYEISKNVVKNICSLGNTVKLYYTNGDCIRCTTEIFDEIISVTAV